MKIDVYETKDSADFVLTPAGAGVAALPQDVKARLKSETPWKTVELNQKTIGANPQQAETEFASKGYSIQRPQITFRESDTSRSQRASAAARKAAVTRKRRGAGRKAATTRKRRLAGKKAAVTRKRRSAGRKAAATRARKRAA
jgi:hypothetical protein